MLDAFLAAFPDPHPELLDATRSTPAQVLEATDNMGWTPAVPFLVPAVPARTGGMWPDGGNGGDGNGQQG